MMKHTHIHTLPYPLLSLTLISCCRIPEGKVEEGGALAVGRLRSLEDQLTRAKQKIHSFQRLTGDGEQNSRTWEGHVGGEKRKAVGESHIGRGDQVELYL